MEFQAKGNCSFKHVNYSRGKIKACSSVAEALLIVDLGGFAGSPLPNWVGISEQVAKVWGGHVEAHFRVACWAFPRASLVFPVRLPDLRYSYSDTRSEWTPLREIR
jgi:hypothetical protein